MSGRRGRIPALLWWLVAALVAVVAGAVIWGVPHEEDNLAASARAALEDEAVTVEFEGRDAFLAGELGDSADIDRALATVRQLEGVRRVSGRGLTVAAPPDTTAPAAPAAPELTLEISGGTITIAGTVPDQATAAAINAAASGRWGAGNVVDRLRVDENTMGAAWLAGSVAAVAGAADLTEGQIAIGPQGVLLAGTVPTESARQTIGGNLAAALGAGSPVTNRLVVVSLDAPTFSAQLLDDGTVQLRGMLPDAARRDAIVTAASGVFGSAAVTDEMTVGANVADPAFLDAIPGVFGAIDGLNPWTVTVEDGRVVLAGLAVSDGAIESTGFRLGVIFAGTGLDLETQVDVDVVAVGTVLTELLEEIATFQVASSRLSEEATALLDEAVAILAANPTTIVTVEGHTDDVGSDESNLELSQTRAQVVVDYLVAGGIDAGRLTAIGYGESRPIADNSTADGRAQNRRIQFVVVEGANQ